MERFLPNTEITTVIFIDEEAQESPSMVWLGWTEEESAYLPLIRINFAKIARFFDFDPLRISDNIIRFQIMGSIYHEMKKELIEKNSDIVNTDIETLLWLRNFSVVGRDRFLSKDYAVQAIERLLESSVEIFSCGREMEALLDETLDSLRRKGNILESQRCLKCFMCGKELTEEIDKEPEKFIELVMRAQEGSFNLLLHFCSFACKELYQNMKSSFG